MFKEKCKQCSHVKFKGTMTKQPVQKETQNSTKHTEQQDTKDTENKLFLWVFKTQFKTRCTVASPAFVKFK